LGTKFAQAYKIKYQSSTSQEYVYQTCHAVSTRLLALTISTHGDHHGLILPPFLVPIQVIILPILKKNIDEEPIKKAVLDLKNELQQWFRCDVDLSSKRPGDKFYKYELQGVPIRIEIGPSEVENKVVRIVRRDTGEKETIPVHELRTKIEEIMRSITINLKERAIKKWNVSEANTLEQVSEIITNQGGLVRVHVYDPHLDSTSTQTDEEKLEYGNSLENKVYEATNGGEIRGYSPTDEYTNHGKCIFTDRDANTLMYIAKQ
jgi:prolyl-tRNA synthetase